LKYEYHARIEMIGDVIHRLYGFFANIELDSYAKQSVVLSSSVLFALLLLGWKNGFVKRMLRSQLLFLLYLSIRVLLVTGHVVV